MSWISELYKTYEYLEKKEIPELFPPAILELQAHINVILNENAEFITADFIEEEKSTPFLVTENSAARTKKPDPHGMFDYLKFVAGDINRYTERSNEYYTTFYTYLENLKKLAESSYSNQFISIVYEYLKKERLLEDILNVGLLSLESDGKFKIGKRINGIEQEKLKVRFSIEKGGEIYDLWKMKSFLENYSKYYISTIPKEKTGFCYVTGEEKLLAKLHGKNIRYAGDGAKLISSNDSTNYTYRGRFEDSSEVYGVSFEVSQKAHSALRYLIKKQGVTKNDHTILTWINSEYFPKVFDATSSSLDFFNEEDEFDIKEIDTLEKFSSEMEKLINGRKTKYNFNQKVNTISLDSATTGRMSIVYYSEKSVNDYLENIRKWNTETSWKQVGFKDKKSFDYIGTVSPYDIIKYSFGKENKKKIMELGSNDKHFNQLLKRLLPCIIDGAKVPRDFVLQAVRNASNPLNKSEENWEKCVNIACGLLKKYYLERKGVEFTLALDKNIDDRSYLFGRLLAVADMVETVVLKERKENRITNAKKLMTIFSNRPNDIWKVIEHKINPYWKHLSPYHRRILEDSLNEIMIKIDAEKYNNDSLEGLYLLGYHCQTYELNKILFKKKEEN